MPSPIVRTMPGFQLSCTATGTPPIYTALLRDTTVLLNTTKTATIYLYKEGRYSRRVKNQYGTDVKDFSVIFAGESL